MKSLFIQCRRHTIQNSETNEGDHGEILHVVHSSDITFNAYRNLKSLYAENVHLFQQFDLIIAIQRENANDQAHRKIEYTVAKLSICGILRS